MYAVKGNNDIITTKAAWISTHLQMKSGIAEKGDNNTSQRDCRAAIPFSRQGSPLVNTYVGRYVSRHLLKTIASVFLASMYIGNIR